MSILNTEGLTTMTLLDRGFVSFLESNHLINLSKFYFGYSQLTFNELSSSILTHDYVRIWLFYKASAIVRVRKVLFD
jgi:hypothetical protein